MVAAVSMANTQYPPVQLEYKSRSPSAQQSIGAAPWLLAILGAVCTFLGLAAAVGSYPRWVELPSARAYERAIISGVVLITLIGMPLAVGALLMLRQRSVRGEASRRPTNPAALIAFATLVVPAVLALPLGLLWHAPHMTMIFAWALVLLMLAGLIWFGGLLSQRDRPD